MIKLFTILIYYSCQVVRKQHLYYNYDYITNQKLLYVYVCHDVRTYIHTDQGLLGKCALYKCCNTFLLCKRIIHLPTVTDGV